MSFLSALFSWPAPLIARDAIPVFQEAAKILKKGGQDLPGGPVQNALVQALGDKRLGGAKRGSGRVLALLRDIGYANGHANDSGDEVVQWLGKLSRDDQIKAIDNTIAYLK